MPPTQLRQHLTYQNMKKEHLSKTNKSAPNQTKGLTSPISLTMPTPDQLLLTDELHSALVAHNVFESDKELARRLDVLGKLNTLVKKWIRDTAIAKHLPIEMAAQLGGKIATFGSYRLGVHGRGADIDALCIAPRNIESTDFFRGFYKILKAQDGVTECRSIEEAYVPVIKMDFDGIEIDLLFARLSLPAIPNDFTLHDDQLLRNLDQRSVRSLNGCRVTDAILQLVPNKENFCLALRAIKLWAKKRGIYSNAMGYFGGVTWAMLMARTCQLYPNATASILVQKLFLVFSNWKWPNPVLLKQQDNIDFGFQVWDPRINQSDRYHLMPVITPAYPQQNSTFNVTTSTRKIIVDEIATGLQITEDIMQGKATWDRLFESPSFFYKYRHFIVLLATATTRCEHSEWIGLVESRVRLLVGNLERDTHIALAHLNPQKFTYKKTEATAAANIAAPYCSMWFIGLTFEPTKYLNLDLTGTIMSFTTTLMNHASTIRLLKSGMDVDARYVKRKNLSMYLNAEILKRDRQINELSKSPSTSHPSTDSEKSPDESAKTKNIQPKVKKAKIFNNLENTPLSHRDSIETENSTESRSLKRTHAESELPMETSETSSSLIRSSTMTLTTAQSEDNSTLKQSSTESEKSTHAESKLPMETSETSSSLIRSSTKTLTTEQSEDNSTLKQSSTESEKSTEKSTESVNLKRRYTDEEELPENYGTNAKRLCSFETTAKNLENKEVLANTSLIRKRDSIDPEESTEESNPKRHFNGTAKPDGYNSTSIVNNCRMSIAAINYEIDNVTIKRFRDLSIKQT